MSKLATEAPPISHLFIDPQLLTTAQLERLAKRLKRVLGLRYCTVLDRPGDGTATVRVYGELVGDELVEARVWQLIRRVYKPRLLLDEEVGRLRTLHDVLPPPDVRQATARREETHTTTGLRTTWLIPTDILDIHALCPFELNANHFNPDTGEPPPWSADELTRQVAEYFPGHSSQAKEFIQGLDGLRRRYVRLMVAETGPRWRRLSCLGDAASAAFGCFRGIIADAVCQSHQAG